MNTSPSPEEKQHQNPAPHRAWYQWLFIGVVVLYVGGLILVPLAALIVSACASGVGTLVTVLHEPDVRLALWLSLFVSGITVGVHGIFGLVLAWVLVRHRFPGKRFLNALVDLPFAVSPVVAGYMLLLLFGRSGFLSPLTDMVGVKVAFALPGVVLATLFVSFPFMVRELMPIIQALDVEQEYAAATLGAGRWLRFWLVVFPSLKWGIIYGATLTFARALGEFGAALVIGGGIRGRTETATIYIFHALDERRDTEAFSLALLLGGVSVALVVGTELLRRWHAPETDRNDGEG